MIFLDLLVTLIIVMILYVGLEPGPYTIWVMAGTGLGIFLICHWITGKIGSSISGGIMGMGSDGIIRESTRISKLVGFVFFILIGGGIGFGVYWYVSQYHGSSNNNNVLMNGKFPLPGDIKLVGNKLVIEGDLSNYTVAGNEKTCQQIIEQAESLNLISEQSKWADHYYTIGMRYYTIAKERKEEWNTKACYAFAANNFTISSQLPSEGSIKIESQAAYLDCLHELRKPE